MQHAILEKIDETKDKTIKLLQDSPQLEKLKELQTDIINDYFTFVIVGEFKHGKSTFVNALLGEDTLPTDITPTTAAIHSIFYGNQNYYQVVKPNGEIETKNLSYESLQSYTAEANFNPNDVKYLKLFKPAPLLKNRVTLVDTPGVNDLNEHRVDITNQFIPRADAIVFLLDITSPLKQSEVTFLKDTILKYGTDRIIFVANFVDRIEDDEELEDTLDYLKRRLCSITEMVNPIIYTVSSKEALKAKITGDNALLETSGLPSIEAQLQTIAFEGRKQQEKEKHMMLRLEHIHMNLKQEIETVKSMANQSLEALQAEEQSLQHWKEKRDESEQQINNYLTERTEEIQHIVLKSVRAFQESLEKEIINKIEFSQGGNIKALVESQIPMTIRTRFDQWIQQYSEYIFTLLKKLEKQISKALTQSFQQSVHIQSDHEMSLLNYDSTISLDNPGASNPSVKAGVTMGGASAIVLALGGTVLIPVVGMAGLPFLQDKIKEKQWERVKPELIYNTEHLLQQMFYDFERHMCNFLRNSTEKIKNNTLNEFTTLIEHLHKNLKVNIDSKKQRVELDQSYIHELETFIKHMNQMKKELENEYDSLKIRK
ncbi:dynamin family protein [Pontibacillus yanchengensis]|nr:dynamin family protein [Pontibacillus yanchengensis]